MGTHLLRRATAAATVCTGLILTAACQNSEDVPKPLPPVETSTSTTPSESPSTSPTQPPAWQAKYTKQEIAAYEAALDQYATYEQRSEPIWREGKATPAAEQLFKEYFLGWQNQLSRLRLYESSEVQIHGVPTVLDSRPTRVALSKDGQSVTIRQCVDFNPVSTFQYGDRAPSVKDKTRPREIVLSRSVGAKETSWRISVLKLRKGNAQC